MTITLAIDTSTSRTSVAVVDDGVILWSGLRDGATEHGPALPSLVQEGIKVSQLMLLSLVWVLVPIQVYE